MTNKEKHLHSSILRRIGIWTAVITALSSLPVTVDKLYLGLRSLQFVRDSASFLDRAVHRSRGQQPYLKLDVGGDAFALDPQNAAIQSAVFAAAALPDNAAFLTLARSPDAFIQARTGTTGWDLEFQDTFDRSGSSPILFMCEKPVELQRVIKAMQLYRANDAAWSAVCAWERETL